MQPTCAGQRYEGSTESGDQAVKDDAGYAAGCAGDTARGLTSTAYHATSSILHRAFFVDRTQPLNMVMLLTDAHVREPHVIALLETLFLHHRVPLPTDLQPLSTDKATLAVPLPTGSIAESNTYPPTPADALPLLT